MSTVIDIKEARAKDVEVTAAELIVFLEDGRTLAVPISWYPRLACGTPEERTNFRIIGSGAGVHWPDLDEDISIESMLVGRKPGESASSLKRWKEQLESRRKEASGSAWTESEPLPSWWDEG